MPRLLLFAPCQQALVDGATNILSLINLVEGIAVQQFPGVIPDITVVTLWQRNEEEAGVAMLQRVELVSPDGQPVISFETPFVFGNLGQRVMNRTVGIPLSSVGRYELRLFIKPQTAANYSEQPAGSYPLLIQNAPSAQLHFPTH